MNQPASKTNRISLDSAYRPQTLRSLLVNEFLFRCGRRKAEELRIRLQFINGWTHVWRQTRRASPLLFAFSHWKKVERISLKLENPMDAVAKHCVLTGDYLFLNFLSQLDLSQTVELILSSARSHGAQGADFAKLSAEYGLDSKGLLDVQPLEDHASQVVDIPHDASESSCVIFQAVRLDRRFGRVEARRFTSTSPFRAVRCVDDVYLVNPGQVMTVDRRLLLVDPSTSTNAEFVSGLEPQFDSLRSQRGKRQCRESVNSSPEVSMTEAIFLGPRACNYFKAVINAWPMLHNIELVGLKKEIPIVVSQDLPAAAIDALRLLSAPRSIEVRDLSGGIAVERLWIPTQISHQTDDALTPDAFSFTYLPRSVSWARDRILASLGINSTDKSHLRLWIDRSSSYRRLQLHNSVNRFLKENDFQIVDPALLSFEKQVELFHSAQIVAGPTGAHFANLIFMQPGSTVVSIINESQIGFTAHATIAQNLGIRFGVVAGHQLHSQLKFSTYRDWLHDDLEVSSSQLIRALKREIRDRQR